MTNKDRIEKTFRTHYLKLRSVAGALLHDSDLARDVVHDVFASLIASGDMPEVSEAYLVSSVRNRCLNHIRDTDARRRIQSLYLLEQSEYDTDDWPDEETIAAVGRLVGSQLGERCSQVVDMRFRLGMSYSKIASELEISEVAVYKHLRHAIETIRKNLTQHG